MQDTQDDKTSAKDQTERHVKEMMGPLPREMRSAKETDELPDDGEDTSEKVLIIPSSDTTGDASSANGPNISEEESAQDESAPKEESLEEAVNDIAAQEGDEVLAAEDAQIAAAFEVPKQGLKAKLGRFLRAWWGNRKWRYTTISGGVVLVIVLITVPFTRYFLLNTVGVRGSMSLSVLDDSTQLPLKNVSVTVGGQTGQTDTDGVVKLRHVKLGRSTLVIQKRAFAKTTKTVTVGWGSNPLGNFSLDAVGSQYVFMVKDWLSAKPIEKAEASSGEASAVSDKNGRIILTTEATEEATLAVTISAKTYRKEKIAIDANSKATQSVELVPSRKEVFVSNRTGKYDVYKIDVDGKNEKLVLAGSGSERDDMSLVPSPTDEQTALVSTRENVRNKDGFLLSTLTLIDLTDNSATTLAQSEQLQVIGWMGTRVIYLQIAAGASASSPKRYRLVSYDYKTVDKQELASANAFNDVIIAGGNIYYAPAASGGNAQGGLIKSNADGHVKKTLLSQDVWNILRTSYETFNISVQPTWYKYNLEDTLPTKLATAPANPKNRLYADSPDGKHALWVDQRDGKGTLLNYDTATKQDKILVSQSGLTQPVRWLTKNTLIYRIHTDQETADYVLSTNGGTARKIRDVFNVNGQTLWYYY